MSQVRRRLLVHGVVQGVGFRPFVYRMAVGLGLGGFVCNRGDAGVEIVVEGTASAVTEFEDALTHRLPPLARIRKVESESLAPLGETTFRIAASQEIAGAGGAIPP